MRNSKIIYIVFIFVGSFLHFFGCGKGNKSNVAAPPPEKAPIPAPQPSLPPKEKPVYVYSGDKFRDPFVPSGQSSNYKADAVFDPQRATLKGIVNGEKGTKTALLMLTGSGTYFVRSGLIFDVMGKNVKGFTAKVFDQKVVITGEGDNVYEIKIKELEEKEKP
ncbi:MAG: hypothetical protein ACKVQC_01545 [Elusimicrobiota bacterium]